VNGITILETFAEDPQKSLMSDDTGVGLWRASEMYAGIPA